MTGLSFRGKGSRANTVGLNEETIKKYIRELNKNNE
jgi:hypothetical protein